ncbi:MAG: exonuclease domain-containing protein [Streptosporangiaceae bacterium]
MTSPLAADGPLPPLAQIDLVVVDVETTGWLPEQAAITEIGAVRLSAGQAAGEFSTLVNPGQPIPAEIAGLTGITDELVAPAPPIGEVLPWFLAFASGCVLAAHNAPFDIGFLSAAAQSSGIGWPAFAVIDTAVLARLVIGGVPGPSGMPDCKLATLAEFFATRTAPCHRALADAQATADVLVGLLALLAAPRPPVLAALGA